VLVAQQFEFEDTMMQALEKTLYRRRVRRGVASKAEVQAILATVSTPLDRAEVVRVFHPSYVSCLALGERSDYVTGCGDGSARVFDSMDAKTEQFAYPIHTDEIYDIIHLSDNLYASSSYDDRIAVFDSQTGKVSFYVHLDGPQKMVLLDNEAQIIAVTAHTAAGPVVSIVNLHPSCSNLSRVMRTLRYEEIVDPTCLTVGRPGTKCSDCLYVGYRNRDIGVWDWRSGDLRGVWRGHQEMPFSICAVGSNIVSVGEDRTARVWNYKGHCISVLQHNDIPKVVTSFGDHFIVTGTDLGEIIVWDLRKSAKIMTRAVNIDHTKVRDVKVTSDGLILSAANDRTCRIWDFRNEISASALRSSTAEVELPGLERAHEIGLVKKYPISS